MNGSWGGYQGAVRPHGSSYQTTDGLEILTPEQASANQNSDGGGIATRYLYLVLAVGLLGLCVFFGFRQHASSRAASTASTMEEAAPPPPAAPLVTPPVAQFESPIDPNLIAQAPAAASTTSGKKTAALPPAPKKAPAPKPKTPKPSIPHERP